MDITSTRNRTHLTNWLRPCPWNRLTSVWMIRKKQSVVFIALNNCNFVLLKKYTASISCLNRRSINGDLICTPFVLQIASQSAFNQDYPTKSYNKLLNLHQSVNTEYYLVNRIIWIPVRARTINHYTKVTHTHYISVIYMLLLKVQVWYAWIMIKLH